MLCFKEFSNLTFLKNGWETVKKTSVRLHFSITKFNSDEISFHCRTFRKKIEKFGVSKKETFIKKSKFHQTKTSVKKIEKGVTSKSSKVLIAKTKSKAELSGQNLMKVQKSKKRQPIQKNVKV